MKHDETTLNSAGAHYTLTSVHSSTGSFGLIHYHGAACRSKYIILRRYSFTYLFASDRSTHVARVFLRLSGSECCFPIDGYCRYFRIPAPVSAVSVSKNIIT